MKNPGFTLIELVIVVTLVAGLAALSTGWYSRFLSQNAVTNTADQIAGNLRKAQTYAISGKGDANWGMAYASGILTFYKGSTFATRDTARDEATSVNPSISVSGLSDINFSRPSGLPSTIATIVVSAKATTKTITVNSQGGISSD